MNIESLMGFLSQGGSAQAPSWQSMIPAAKQETPEEIAARKRKLQTNNAGEIAKLIDSVMGTAPVQEQTAPFKQELFPGETPIQGLSDITQEGKAGTGMYDESVPMIQRLMEGNQRMIGSGNPELMNAGMERSKSLQGNIATGINQLNLEGAKNKEIPISAAGKMALDAGYAKGSDEYEAFVRKYAGKRTYEAEGDKVLDGTRLEKWEKPDGTDFGPGSTLNSIANAGGRLKKKVDVNAGKTTAYLDAMNISEDFINGINVNSPDFDPANIKDFAARALSHAGALGKVVGSHIESPESKAYFTAALNWISANRAYISGAAVPELEVQRDFETYFPQPNDSDELISMKRELRLNRKDALTKSSTLSDKERGEQLRRGANNDSTRIMLFKTKASAPKYSDPKKQDAWEKFQASKRAQ